MLSGGTAIAQGFTVVAAPLITRLYAPASIGQFALFTSFLNVAITALSLRYELGIPAASTEQKAAHLTFAAGIFVLPTSVLCAALFSMTIRFSLLGFGTIPSHTALIMIPALIAAGGFTVLRYWCVREERFREVSQVTIVQHVTRSFSQILLGAFGGRLAGLIAGEVLGRCASMIRLFRSVWPRLHSQVFPVRMELFRQTLWEDRQFPLYSLPSSLMDNLAANILIPLIVQYYGSGAGGHFALVQRVLAVPLVLISSSVADAFHARLALHARTAPTRVASLFRHTAAGLFVLGAIPALALMLFAPRLFGIFFGFKWTTSGVLAALVAPWFLANFVITPLSRLVLVLEGQRLKLVYDLVALGTEVAVFVFAGVRRLTLPQAVLLLSATGTAAYAVYFLVLMRILSVWSNKQRLYAA